MLLILAKVKLRLGIMYSDPKDLEIAGRIDACAFDMLNAGVPQANLSSELAMDTIERYINGGQNDSIYIANVLKLRGMKNKNTFEILHRAIKLCSGRRIYHGMVALKNDSRHYRHPQEVSVFWGKWKSYGKQVMTLNGGNRGYSAFIPNLREP